MYDARTYPNYAKTLPSYVPGTVCLIIDGTIGAVLERSIAALRVAGSIPARNKQSFDLPVVVSSPVVCVCDFSIFVTHESMIQELFVLWGKV